MHSLCQSYKVARTYGSVHCIVETAHVCELHFHSHTYPKMDVETTLIILKLVPAPTPRRPINEKNEEEKVQFNKDCVISDVLQQHQNSCHSCGYS